MSNQKINRQPSGQPTGGQFAETNKPASGVNLSPPGQAPEGIQPWELLEAIRGGTDWDVETVAIRDNWGAKDWEEWEDARERADLEDARSESVQHEGLTAGIYTSETDDALVAQVDTEDARGRNIRVYINDVTIYDGDPTIYDGDPEVDETLEQQAERLASAPLSVRMSAAMERFHQAREEMERLSAGIVTEMVREQYPGARYMTLEHSDQGDYWEGAEILGDDRETLGEWDDVAYGDRENEAIYLSNLDSHATYPFIVPAAEGRTMYFDLDEAAKYAAS